MEDLEEEGEVEAGEGHRASVLKTRTSTALVSASRTSTSSSPLVKPAYWTEAPVDDSR